MTQRGVGYRDSKTMELGRVAGVLDRLDITSLAEHRYFHIANRHDQRKPMGPILSSDAGRASGSSA